MDIHVFDTKQESGQEAALQGAKLIRAAIKEKGFATIILATGASQFEMLEHLVKEDVDWSKVEAFHLDEYINLPITHPASFRKYLKERFVGKVKGLKKMYYIDGDVKDVTGEIQRISGLIAKKAVDVAFVGIGENGHLAFNDPPADFAAESPYLVVTLDMACRKQQLGEGWFPTIADVPSSAISMSIRQIMKSRAIINTVPDARKAKAVAECIEGPVTNLCPASVLQNHQNCHWYLDKHSASLLK